MKVSVKSHSAENPKKIFMVIKGHQNQLFNLGKFGKSYFLSGCEDMLQFVDENFFDQTLSEKRDIEFIIMIINIIPFYLWPLSILPVIVC